MNNLGEWGMRRRRCSRMERRTVGINYSIAEAGITVQNA